MKWLLSLTLCAAILAGCSQSAPNEPQAPATEQANQMVESPMRSGDSTSPPADAPSGTSPGMGSDLQGGIQQAAKGQAREAAAKAGGGSVGAETEGSSDSGE